MIMILDARLAVDSFETFRLLLQRKKEEKTRS